MELFQTTLQETKSGRRNKLIEFILWKTAFLYNAQRDILLVGWNRALHLRTMFWWIGFAMQEGTRTLQSCALPISTSRNLRLCRTPRYQFGTAWKLSIWPKMSKLTYMGGYCAAFDSAWNVVLGLSGSYVSNVATAWASSGFWIPFYRSMKAGTMNRDSTGLPGLTDAFALAKEFSMPLKGPMTFFTETPLELFSFI